MNIQLLEKKIAEKGLKKKYLATLLNIDKSTLSYKINGKRNFMVREIKKISEILSLTDEEKLLIFFRDKVDL